MAHFIGADDPNEQAVEYIRIDPESLPKIYGAGRGQWTDADDREWAIINAPFPVFCRCHLCRWIAVFPDIMPPALTEEDEWAEIRAALRNEPVRRGSATIGRKVNADY